MFEQPVQPLLSATSGANCADCVRAPRCRTPSWTTRVLKLLSERRFEKSGARTIKGIVLSAICAVAALGAATGSMATGFPTPKEGEWIIRDFRFRSGEVIPELRIH